MFLCVVIDDGVGVKKPVYEIISEPSRSSAFAAFLRRNVVDVFVEMELLKKT